MPPVLADFLMMLVEQAPTVAALLFLVVRQESAMQKCVGAIIDILLDRERVQQCNDDQVED